MVIVHEVSLFAIAGAEMLLAVLEDISLAAALVNTRRIDGGAFSRAKQLRAGFIHGWLSDTVLAETVVKSFFSETVSVHGAETSGIARNVGVAATSIVGVDDRLGVDMSMRFCWALFLDNK